MGYWLTVYDEDGNTELYTEWFKHLCDLDVFVIENNIDCYSYRKDS
jgi:hypothetical protein